MNDDRIGGGGQDENGLVVQPDGAALCFGAARAASDRGHGTMQHELGETIPLERKAPTPHPPTHPHRLTCSFVLPVARLYVTPADDRNLGTTGDGDGRGAERGCGVGSKR